MSRFRQKPETPVEQQWREKRKTMYEQLERKEHLKDESVEKPAADDLSEDPASKTG